MLEGRRGGPHHQDTLPSPAQEAPLEAGKILRRIAEAEQLEGWGGCHHHCQPKSWPRWLWRLGHLCQVGRSQPGGSSDLPWEAKSPGRNSSRMARSRKPRSTNQVQLPSVKSGSSKRAQSSYLEIPLLLVTLPDSPRSGQIWFVLPGVHYYMPTARCRGIYSRPHGRC